MGINSRIEWTHHTFNPWWGCVKVSPACDHCYAEAWAKRTGFDVWGKDADRRFFSDAHWHEPVKWDRAAEKAGERHRVFCGSMCDVMEDATGLQQIREEKLYPLIEATPHLDWLLLTKRPQNFARFLPSAWLENSQPNVWLMTTVESDDYIWRAVELIKVPAVVHGLSYEPALGPLTKLAPLLGIRHEDELAEVGANITNPDQHLTREIGVPFHDPWVRSIDWVIVGGESGPGARPMHPDWVRAIRDECAKCGAAFFFKQWGEWLPADQFGADGDKPTPATTDRSVVRADGGCEFYRVGKRDAGRLLDGREHLDFPVPASVEHNTQR